MTDTELIQGILKRDRQAFQYLIDKYRKGWLKQHITLQAKWKMQRTFHRKYS